MKNENSNAFFDWVKSTAITCIVMIAFMTFIASPAAVKGASMMPTYEDGDLVILNKIGKKLSGIERQDVIILEAPTGGTYIKRVIGLAGDDVAYENDTLYVNGEAVEESYLDEYKQQLQDGLPLTFDFTLQSATGYDIIPEGYVFVLGDNRRKSLDSRDPNVGLVPMDKVLGKTSIRFYPLNEIAIVN